MRSLFLQALVCMLLLPLASCRLLSDEDRTRESDARQVRPSQEKILFEEPHAPAVREAARQPRPPVDRAGAGLPMVAIIIDDMGYHGRIGRDLLALNLNLTFSFLPGAPFTKQQEETAWVKGRTVMLHLPMQAKSSRWNPGPGAIYSSFSPQRIRSVVLEDLKSVPHAVGCNNHMGSGFTENRKGMREVLAVLKEQRLFFIDSFTTSASIGMAEARMMGVATARRQVFLDNVQDVGRICRQLDHLLALARDHGQAIGIAHPHRATLEALRRCGSGIGKRADLVGVDRLVR